MSDFDRPLNARGERAAPQMARHLATVVGLRPDYVVSSPALRALSTARVLAPALGISEAAIHPDIAIYTDNLHTLVSVVQQLPAVSSNAMLFGHMPGIQDVANHFLGHEAIGHFPTCGVAMLELKIDAWHDAKCGCGRLIDFLHPKMLGDSA